MDTEDRPVIHAPGTVKEDRIRDVPILSPEDDSAPEGCATSSGIGLKKRKTD